GYREKKELSDRRHFCLACGYQTSRDHNAAQNILALGLDGLGISPRIPRLKAWE
ncbi:MAG: transposase, partial [Verrucomicrobia bacterium]|nr:transposase [Verrucomicrobiota bacterium]